MTHERCRQCEQPIEGEGACPVCGHVREPSKLPVLRKEIVSPYQGQEMVPYANVGPLSAAGTAVCVVGVFLFATHLGPVGLIFLLILAAGYSVRQLMGRR